MDETKRFFFIVQVAADEEEDDEKDEWQGTIKTMTRVFTQNNIAFKKTIIDQTNKM